MSARTLAQVTLERLTFGFELEGLFERTLDMHPLLAGGQWKNDGSVKPPDPLPEFSYNSSVLEFASPVYHGIAELMAALELFTPDVYAPDLRSCGLHLHIGQRYASVFDRLRQSVCDLTFLEEVQRAALSWCGCQRERLTGVQKKWCLVMPTGQELLHDYANGQKYRLVRFHPRHTLEWRFFAPCEHKLENVRTFLAMLTEHIGKTSTEVVSGYVPVDANGLVARINGASIERLPDVDGAARRASIRFSR